MLKYFYLAKAEIVKDLEHICNSTMPSSWRNKCDNFVDIYGTQIIHFLLNEATPDLICQMVGACHSENQIFEITKTKDSKQLYEFDEVISEKIAKY